MSQKSGLSALLCSTPGIRGSASSLLLSDSDTVDRFVAINWSPSEWCGFAAVVENQMDEFRLVMGECCRRE